MSSATTRFAIINNGRSGSTLLVDVIRVMDRGRVVESGARATFAAIDGQYLDPEDKPHA